MNKVRRKIERVRKGKRRRKKKESIFFFDLSTEDC